MFGKELFFFCVIATVSEANIYMVINIFEMHLLTHYYAEL